MSPDEFIAKCLRTAPTEYPYVDSKLVHPDILHAWLGVTTECGESGDVLKKALIYGKEPDLVNLDEEFADKLWYISLYCFRRGITYEYLFDLVINKLIQRFPDKFTQDDAINRDLQKERAVLEAYAKDPQAQQASADLILTRLYIKLFGASPEKDTSFFDPRTAQWYTYNGTTWEVQ